MKNVQQSESQREIEREHEQRKGQIDSFFANLRNKVENEQRQKEAAAAEEEKKDIKEVLKEAAATSEDQFQNMKLEITPFKEFAEKLEMENRQDESVTESQSMSREDQSVSEVENSQVSQINEI